MTITFLSDDRYRKGWLWQTFSRQTKREMLLVTVRSFVCQLVAGLDEERERESGWTARKQLETWHGPVLLIVAALSISTGRERCTLDYVSRPLVTTVTSADFRTVEEMASWTNQSKTECGLSGWINDSFYRIVLGCLRRIHRVTEEKQEFSQRRFSKTR